jgi:opacity protein-like surface antigen
MMSRVLLAAGLLVLLSSAVPANLLVNGDFEQPLETGWKDTVYSLAGDYRYERSDTFGQGTGQAAKARKYLAKFASLRQAVPVPGADLTLSFDARLNIGGGSSTCWPVAAVFVRYLDASGAELGATCWYNHHPSADWLDNDTMNLVEVTSFDWNRYELRIAQEIATNLPGVSPEDVGQVMFDLFAYDNGT